MKTDPALRRLVLPSLLPGLLLLTLAGCKPGYSPNTYAASAAQQEAAVQRGVIIGVRQVQISANGTIGAAAGGAAGGVAGAQIAGAPMATALGAIGGTLVGGIGGAAAAQAVADAKGWEYIVQEEPGDRLVSVTQTSKMPLAVGLHVLVIADSQQARIVPDYTVQPAPPPAANAPAASAGAASTEINVPPLVPDAGTLAPLQLAPIDTGSGATPPQAPAPAAPALAPAVMPSPASSASPAPATPPATTAAPPVQAAPAVPVSTSPATPPGASTSQNADAPLPAGQKKPN